MSQYWVGATLKLKQSFLNMFFGLINNYLICYKPELVPGDQPVASDIFNFEKYLSFFDETRLLFMTELCKTQHFIAFIEKSQKAKEQQNELLFFTEGIKLCSKKGEKALAQKVKKITDQLLQKNKNVLHNSRYIAHFLFPRRML